MIGRDGLESNPFFFAINVNAMTIDPAHQTVEGFFNVAITLCQCRDQLLQVGRRLHFLLLLLCYQDILVLTLNLGSVVITRDNLATLTLASKNSNRVNQLSREASRPEKS